MEKIEFLPKTGAQLTQFVDAAAVFEALEAAEAEAAKYRGSMFWKKVSGKEYLIRMAPDGSQKSLGPRTEANSSAADKFMQGKEIAEARRKSLREEAAKHRRLNVALRVGRAPPTLIQAINALRDAGLEDYFFVIGTHALHAYETMAGVWIPGEIKATQDADFMFDSRKRVKFFTAMDRLDMSLLDIFKKIDKTFTLKPFQSYTAVNASGFEIDIVRRSTSGNDDPHPLRMSEHEDDFWAVQLPKGNELLGARRISQIVVASNGEMARMNTIHPDDFARVKRVIASSPARDPIKAHKDLWQAQAVEELVSEYLAFLRSEARGTK